jgi:hypothetical protein
MHERSPNAKSNGYSVWEIDRFNSKHKNQEKRTPLAPVHMAPSVGEDCISGNKDSPEKLE